MTTLVDPQATTWAKVELEITGRCQLQCRHCLTESSPLVGHGDLTTGDWLTLIEQAAEVGFRTIQFIGGEPTLRADLPLLIEHALKHVQDVEVYSNLYKVSDALWDLFRQPRVHLATSYYSDEADQHDAITGRRGSFMKTRANIVRALSEGITLRIGIVVLSGDQRAAEAYVDLRAMGVPRAQINTDRARGIGRARQQLGLETGVGELCGGCGKGRAAILPDGTLAPCVLGRILPVGSVLATPLAELLTSVAWREAVSVVPAKLTRSCSPEDSGDCDPANTSTCGPDYCNPDCNQ
ncbi:MAG TPA: radical SAM protein [Actinocrinis sp.]|nr:radical SAM protein [Actinocrinis sp.]